MHAVIEELNLINDKKKALEILNFLLDHKKISGNDVKAASEAVAGNKHPPKKNSESVQSTNIRTRHIALKFYYDGGNYSGLAENVGFPFDRSVERALLDALRRSKLIQDRESCGLSRCGRTDKGVSAAGQVIALRVKSAFTPEASWDEAGEKLLIADDLPSNSFDKKEAWTFSRKSREKRQKRRLSELPYDRILNNLLPDDIRILGWTPVSDEFSARFSATTRTYRYFFRQGADLDLDLMRQSLTMLVGRHDFRNFCKMNVEQVSNFEREIHSADIHVESECGTREHRICYLQIVGQAFLWHQIRCIVTILFMVGRKLEKSDIVKELLNVAENPGKPSYDLAAERPLVLHDCGFRNLQMGYSATNLLNLHIHFTNQWEQLALAAARVMNCWKKLDLATVLAEDVVELCRTKKEEYIRKMTRYSLSTGENQAVGNPEWDSAYVDWKTAIEYLGTHLPNLDRGALLHVPLSQRSKGPSYEERVESVQRSTKRRERYVENIINKKQTREEDRAFYQHKIQQGGSASSQSNV